MCIDIYPEGSSVQDPISQALHHVAQALHPRPYCTQSTVIQTFGVCGFFASLASKGKHFLWPEVGRSSSHAYLKALRKQESHSLCKETDMENRRNVTNLRWTAWCQKCGVLKLQQGHQGHPCFPVVCEVFLIPCRLAQGIEANQSFNNCYGNVRYRRDLFRATM